MSEWPKTLVTYLHGSKETNWDDAKTLGLAAEAAAKFKYALYEVTVTLSVNEDGTYTITAFKE